MRDRLNLLKMQYDQENTVKKHNTLQMTDNDMKKLQMERLKRSRERLGEPRHTRSDEDLDEFEVKIIQVELFDALEGLDADLRS